MADKADGHDIPMTKVAKGDKKGGTDDPTKFVRRSLNPEPVDQEKKILPDPDDPKPQGGGKKPPKDPPTDSKLPPPSGGGNGGSPFSGPNSQFRERTPKVKIPPVLWIILIILTAVVGTIIYMLMRPPGQVALQALTERVDEHDSRIGDLEEADKGFAKTDEVALEITGLKEQTDVDRVSLRSEIARLKGSSAQGVKALKKVNSLEETITELQEVDKVIFSDGARRGGQIATLEKKVGTLQTLPQQVTDLKGETQANTSGISAVNRRINAAEGDIAQNRQDVGRLNDRVDGLEAEFRELARKRGLSFEIECNWYLEGREGTFLGFGKHELKPKRNSGLMAEIGLLEIAKGDRQRVIDGCEMIRRR